MLQGFYTTRSENYDPMNFFRSPILAGSWFSCLNDNKHCCEGARLMICFPPSNYQSNFMKMFRRHCIEKSESYHVESQLPMSAETYGGIRVYPIKNQDQVRMY